MLGKLLGVASVGGTLASVTMLQKFLSGITTVVALTIVSAMMVSLFLICGFSLLYLELTRNGLDAVVALAVVGGMVFLITATLVTLAIIRVRALRELPMHSLMHTNIPALGQIHDIAESFLKGLLSSRHPPVKRRAHPDT